MTILFKKDWNAYPTAAPDFTTTNKSAIKLASLYKAMGVKNWAFPLALVNQDLKGVDPHSPDLTIEQQAAIVVECKINFWYAVREVVMVPPVAGVEPVRYRMNRANVAMHWLFLNHIATINIIGRQQGKTLAVLVLFLLLLNVRMGNSDITALTKDEVLRGTAIKTLRELNDELPYFMNLQGKLDSRNTHEFTTKELNNRFLMSLPSSSPKAADKTGRGLSTAVCWFEEAVFCPNISISLPAALAAGTAAREEAEDKLEPYGTIITTTAGKLSDKDGKYIHDLLSNSAVWTEKFFDCEDEKQLEMVIRNSSKTGEPRVNCTFNHRQLGRTDAWLRKAIEAAMVTGDAARRDFMNEWTTGSTSHPLDLEILERISKSTKEPLYTEIVPVYNYIVRWYINEPVIDMAMQSRPMILALDSSDAIGSDEISLTIRDPYTGAIIAAGTYNTTNLTTFSKWLFTWFEKYPKLVGIVERRSSGAGILDYLLLMMAAKGMNPFKRLFNRVVNDKGEFPTRFKELDVYDRHHENDLHIRFKKYFGFATSGSGITSRNDLYSSTLVEAARVTGNVVHDKITAEQILTLESKNGRIDHSSGGHDDTVISWLLSFWIITRGSNLSYYGIDPVKVLSNVPIVESSKPVTQQERRVMDKQAALRKIIKRLTEDYKRNKDQFIRMKIEHQLRAVSAEVIPDENEDFTIEKVLSDLKEQDMVSPKKKKVVDPYKLAITGYG